MKAYLLIFGGFFIWQNGLAQLYQARITEEYTFFVDTLKGTLDQVFLRNNNELEQMEGFPKATLAHPVHKNVRNVTLADLNEDGIDDIIWSTNRTIFVYQHDSLLWKRSLSGVLIYPPSVADLDNDGDLEIVQATGGNNPKMGRIYALNHNGNDLPGWPKNYNNNWIIAAPTLVDLDEDKQLEIIFNERINPIGRVHILNLDGSSFSDDWPVTLERVPAVTPSVGDVDNDGALDIVVFSTGSRYVFDLDGEPKAGWPLETDPFQRFSFQSPLLVDFDQDKTLEIVGASHGDLPEFFILNSDGTFRQGWPQTIQDTVWTFNAPTVVKLDEDYRIFMGKRTKQTPDSILFQWNKDGVLQEGFPKTNLGGVEGIIAIADIDNDDEFEVITGTNLFSQNGNGFIHAYEMDENEELEGFPLQPRGLTFMNGVNIGDVNGDGLMDLIALSYTVNFGAGIDSCFLNVYELGVPYSPDKVLWGTYKGSNDRVGLVSKEILTNLNRVNEEVSYLSIIKNPVRDVLNLVWRGGELETLELHIYNVAGVQVANYISGYLGKDQLISIPIGNINTGVYILQARKAGEWVQTIKFVKH